MMLNQISVKTQLVCEPVRDVVKVHKARIHASKNVNLNITGDDSIHKPVLEKINSGGNTFEEFCRSSITKPKERK